MAILDALVLVVYVHIELNAFPYDPDIYNRYTFCYGCRTVLEPSSM